MHDHNMLTHKAPLHYQDATINGMYCRDHTTIRLLLYQHQTSLITKSCLHADTVHQCATDQGHELTSDTVHRCAPLWFGNIARARMFSVAGVSGSDAMAQ